MNRCCLSLATYFLPFTNYHVPSTIHQLPTSSLRKGKARKKLRAKKHRKSMGVIAAVIVRGSKQSCKHSTNFPGGHILSAWDMPYGLIG